VTTPVISLGGSIFSKEGERYLETFISGIKKERKYAIVVGGGPQARERISWLRKMGVGEYQLDMMGIHFTRVNALSLSLALGEIEEVPTTIDAAVRDFKIYGKVIMGGTEPGHTTDAVSLLLAEAIGSRTVINVTNVDGLYDRNPDDPGARRLKEASYVRAIKMLSEEKRRAGANFPLDILSLNIARRSEIKIKIVSFKDMENVFNCIKGKRYEGTVIG